MPALWFRMDVDFAENRKLTAISVNARWLHVAALCYCARNLTDGKLDERAVKTLNAVCETNAKRLIPALLEVGLWRQEQDGSYWINDYLKHQRSREEAQSRSDAGKKGAAARWNGKSSTNGNANRIANGNAQTEKLGVNPERPTTTWQPANGVRNPAAVIAREIGNGVYHDRISLDAELAAHKLTDGERVALITMLEARAA